MIAVDTSALMAIVLNETEANACIEILDADDNVVISTATIAEALIVAVRRNVGDEMEALIDGLGLNAVAVTIATARRVARAYDQWGKGRHGAKLNFGDCFAYDIAKEHDCPLLFVGNDFAKTDVKRAL